MGKRPYDTSSPDQNAAREILLDWLRDNPTARQIPHQGRTFLPFVECGARCDPDQLASDVMAAFWELVIEGIIVPGINAYPTQTNLPWFRLTPYGKRILSTGAGHPHDPAGYLARIREGVPSSDDTVLAYLAGSLHAFGHASHVAAMIMLGIAAERVFLILCDSLNAALANASERATFTKILERFPIKPKLDWVHDKFQRVHAARPPGFPDNATLMITAIYDILRSQRNDLGHPRELPPAVDREEAFANLQVFPHFYEAAERVRTWLATNKV